MHGVIIGTLHIWSLAADIALSEPMHDLDTEQGLGTGKR